MASNTTGEGELFEESLKTFLVFRLVWVYFAIHSLEIGLRDDCWSAVAWARDEEPINVVFLDESVEMDVSKDLACV